MGALGNIILFVTVIYAVYYAYIIFQDIYTTRQMSVQNKVEDFSISDADIQAPKVVRRGKADAQGDNGDEDDYPDNKPVGPTLSQLLSQADCQLGIAPVVYADQGLFAEHIVPTLNENGKLYDIKKK